MKDSVVFVRLIGRDWPHAGKLVGEMVVLNDCVVFRKAVKPRGRTWRVSHDPEDLAKNVAHALGVRVERRTIKVHQWWRLEDVQACIRGILRLPPAERRLLRGRRD